MQGLLRVILGTLFFQKAMKVFIHVSKSPPIQLGENRALLLTTEIADVLSF